MSYISTYDRKLPKPKGIGLAIGVHAIVIAAVIAMPGVNVVRHVPGEIEGIFIAKPEPKKPISEPDEPLVKLPPQNTIDNPVKPVDDLPRAPDVKPTPFTSDGGDITFGGGIGTGDGIPIDPIEAIEITPDPVFVEPRLNSRFASQFQPRYPTGLLRLEEEGVVSVKVLVGTNGRAKDIRLLSTPHQDFWDSTRKHALKKWRFKPATEDGKPVESWITLKVKFEINA